MKKPTIKQLLEKIEALEAKIDALEKAPRETHNHFHTHYQQQPYAPAPVWGTPVTGLPYRFTCGSNAG